MPSPFLDWLAIINLLGVVQGFLLSGFFLTVPGTVRTPGRLLGLLLLGLTLLVTDLFLSYTNYIQYVPFLVNSTESVAFLIGPLAYFYTLSLTGTGFRWRRYWLHLTPGILQFISRIPFYLQSNALKIQDTAGAFHRIVPDYERIPVRNIWWFPGFDGLEGFWLDVLSFSSLFVYFVVCFWSIKKYTRQRQEPFWKAANPALKALPRLMALFIAFLVAAVAFTFTAEDDLGDIYIASASSLVFYGITFFLLTHPELLNARPETSRRKYGKSALPAELAGTLKDRLLAYMTVGRPYLEGELTLPQLAENLKTSTHHLSQVINEQLGMNFSISSISTAWRP